MGSQTLNIERLDNIQSSCLLLFTIFLMVSSFNAGYSISLAILIIFELYRYFNIKNKQPMIIRSMMPPKVILKLFGLFFCALLISAVYHGGSTIHSTWKYIYWAFPFIPLFYSYVKDKAELAFFMGSCVALLILSVKGWMQIRDLFLDIQVKLWRVTSMFSAPNDYGQVVEQVLPVVILGSIWVFYKWKTSHEKIYLYSFVVQAVTIILSLIPFIGSFSRGAMAGFVGGGLFVIILYSVISIKRYIKYILVIMLSILAVVSGFFALNKVADSNMRSMLPSNTVQASLVSNIPDEFFNHHSDTGTDISRVYDKERLLMWESSYNMWKDHPVLGVGFDQWQQQYEKHYIMDSAEERIVPMPHNNTVYFFSTTGIVGGIAYIVFSIGVLIYFVIQMYKNPQNILLPIMIWMWCAIMVHGQVDSGITNKFVMHILCGTMGLVCGSIKNHPINNNYN